MRDKQRNILLITGIIIAVFITLSIFITVIFYPFIIVPPNGGEDRPDYELPPSTPTLYNIRPDPDSDGEIILDWSASSSVWYYNVYRRRGADGIDEKIAEITGSYFTDSVTKSGLYYYRIEAVNNIGCAWSNQESVTINLPLFFIDPSISINDGAETTNSIFVTLKLYCGNADEMQFQIMEGFWTNWTAYATTYIITLFQNDPFYPDYRIEVVFRSGGVTTKDAGYTGSNAIFDDITYVIENGDGNGDGNGDDNGDGNGDDNGDDKPVDYTLIYVLLGVLVGLVGIGIFLKYRKQIIKSK